MHMYPPGMYKWLAATNAVPTATTSQIVWGHDIQELACNSPIQGVLPAAGLDLLIRIRLPVSFDSGTVR